jgi:predicted MPP superfamily phosphohydrolase
MLSRRTFLKAASVGAAGFAVAAARRDMEDDGYTGTPVIERLTISLPDLPKDLASYRIGFLTDLHLGMWVPPSWITHALETLQRERVDILLLGGDYIFVSDNPVWSATRAIRNSDYIGLSRRETAAKAFSDALRLISQHSYPDGTYAVVGNHEHWNSIELFQLASKEFPSIRVLINEEVSVHRGVATLNILGVDDHLTGFPMKPPPRPGSPKEHTRILLSHNPDYVATLLEEEMNAFDIALCGHTHGGQVCIPGLTGTIIPVQDPRFMVGLTRVNSGYVYTSRGLGVVGLPFRVNCPPEITIIELQRV